MCVRPSAIHSACIEQINLMARTTQLSIEKQKSFTTLRPGRLFMRTTHIKEDQELSYHLKESTINLPSA